MFENLVACPHCSETIDARNANTTTVSKISIHCPQCKQVARESHATECWSINRADDQIDTIEDWLATYSKETGRRAFEMDYQFGMPIRRWSVPVENKNGFAFDVAIETEGSGILLVRSVSNRFEDAFEDAFDDAATIAGKFGAQVSGTILRTGSGKPNVLWNTQIPLCINRALPTTLLVTTIERLEAAASEVLEMLSSRNS